MPFTVLLFSSEWICMRIQKENHQSTITFYSFRLWIQSLKLMSPRIKETFRIVKENSKTPFFPENLLPLHVCCSWPFENSLSFPVLSIYIHRTCLGNWSSIGKHFYRANFPTIYWVPSGCPESYCVGKWVHVRGKHFYLCSEIWSSPETYWHKGRIRENY
jgi:hypothetical protein